MNASLRPDPHMTPEAFRARCRSGDYQGPSAGFAAGFVQANLVIVPKDWAFEFLLFCQRNPKPCPLIEVLDEGQVEPSSAKGADLRSDLPAYRIYQDGALVKETSDITDVWHSDMVSFLIGCSFSFEAALIADGIELRHIKQSKNVAMYRTTLPCVPAGRLAGPLVVSMRPIKSADVARAAEISARFPEVHGAPVHVGHPDLIGIGRLDQPDYGDPIEILEDELPVFWACGVTPQSIAEKSGLPLCITHAPGSMFITDQLMRR
jgi:uncharacterized protein YcsI (UPF0317 family)